MKGRLQHTVDRYRAQLLAHEQQAQQSLERAYRHVLASIQPRLDALYHAMDQATANGEKIPPTWLYEQHRLANLKQYIESQINHFGQSAKMTVAQTQHLAAQLGEQAALDQLKATVPDGVNWTFGRPSRDAIINIVGATQAGSPLADLFDGFGREAADLAGKALTNGITLGSNPRVVARDIQQALGVSRNRALTISRTTMLDAYRNSSLETMRANSDVVGGWIWSASLSARSCAMCIAMNGSEHTLEETMDTHPCCRCVMLPKTNSWDDILGPLGINTSDIPETSIDIQTGADWFDQQDAATQQEILGSKAAYNAYQDGAITLQDLVGTSYSTDWGGSRYQKSLKEAIGAGKAQKYYSR